jgi:hypothetical protein
MTEKEMDALGEAMAQSCSMRDLSKFGTMKKNPNAENPRHQKLQSPLAKEMDAQRGLDASFVS